MKENPDFIYICCLFRKYFKAIFNRQEVISHMLSFLRFSVWCNIDLLVLNGMILQKDVMLQQVNESPEALKYLWYPELEIYGLETFSRQKVLKEMSGVRIMKNKTINYELK